MKLMDIAWRGKYDQNEDALSFVLREGEEERFEEIKPGIFVEFDKKSNIIGFEILDASRVFKPALRSFVERAERILVQR